MCVLRYQAFSDITQRTQRVNNRCACTRAENDYQQHLDTSEQQADQFEC